MKRKLFIATALFSFASSAFGAERTLSGEEITALLPDIAARGGNTYQTFDVGGHTDYSSGGRKSDGSWAVRGDRYCSVWPPSDKWACYGVVLDEEERLIFWVEANGTREKNRYEPRN